MVLFFPCGWRDPIIQRADTAAYLSTFLKICAVSSPGPKDQSRSVPETLRIPERHVCPTGATCASCLSFLLWLAQGFRVFDSHNLGNPGEASQCACLAFIDPIYDPITLGRDLQDKLHRLQLPAENLRSGFHGLGCLSADRAPQIHRSQHRRTPHPGSDSNERCRDGILRYCSYSTDNHHRADGNHMTEVH